MEDLDYSRGYDDADAVDRIESRISGSNMKQTSADA